MSKSSRSTLDKVELSLELDEPEEPFTDIIELSGLSCCVNDGIITLPKYSPYRKICRICNRQYISMIGENDGICVSCSSL